MAGHIFVCYSRRDNEFVLTLAKELKDQGIPIWLDQWDIPPSANWNRTRDNALYEAAQCLVVLSPAAVDSEQVEAEWVTGLEERKAVVPILYQACRIPSRLRLIQRFDFINSGLKDETTMKALVRTLRGQQQTPIVQPQDQSSAVEQKLKSPHKDTDCQPIEDVSMRQAPDLRSAAEQKQPWQGKAAPLPAPEQGVLLFNLEGKLNRERFTTEAFRSLVAATAESHSVGDKRIEVFHVLMSMMRGSYLKGFYQYLTRDTGKELDAELKLLRARIRQAYHRPVVEKKLIVRELQRTDGSPTVLALLDAAAVLAKPGLIEEKHLLTALLGEGPLELLSILQKNGMTLANLQRYIRECA